MHGAGTALPPDIWKLSCKQTTRRCHVSLRLTRSHCLSLLSKIMTSLGCIWYPSSLNDRLRPSNVTFIRYLQRETRRRGTEHHLLKNIVVSANLHMSYICNRCLSISCWVVWLLLNSEESFTSYTSLLKNVIFRQCQTIFFSFLFLFQFQNSTK